MEKPLVENNISKKIFVIAGISLFIIALIPSFFFYTKYQQAQKMLADNSLAGKEETEALVEKVSKLILLPKDEEPKIITVTDINQVKNQPFFTNAKNGDKVLVFQKAKKAILFDPIAGKIIEVGPLIEPSPSAANLSPTTTTSVSPSPSPSLTPSPTTTQTFKAVLYNGTTTVGLTKKIEDILKEKAPHIEISDKDNAKKNDYAKTLVIDLSGKNTVEAQNIVKIVGGEKSTLPAGEIKPENADFLIIVGSDKL